MLGKFPLAIVVQNREKVYKFILNFHFFFSFFARRDNFTNETNPTRDLFHGFLDFLNFLHFRRRPIHAK